MRKPAKLAFMRRVLILIFQLLIFQRNFIIMWVILNYSNVLLDYCVTTFHNVTCRILINFVLHSTVWDPIRYVIETLTLIVDRDEQLF